jgi:ornithine cyclodeaminase
VRPIERIDVWGRTPDKADKLARQLCDAGLNAQPIDSLEAGVERADVISCATMSMEPLIHGHWLKPGQHVDLMGAFKPSMRESDDKAVQVADVFCDTFAGALKEGGDLVQPIQSGALAREAVLADLFDLAQGKHPGRTGDDRITLFKSTGAALEDLAAAVLAYERSGD